MFYDSDVIMCPCVIILSDFTEARVHFLTNALSDITSGSRSQKVLIPVLAGSQMTLNISGFVQIPETPGKS